MYRNVIKIPAHSSSLRKKSKPFPPASEWTTKETSVIEDLQDTFSVLQGYGLAAPQIGLFMRAVVISPRALGLGSNESLVMINPVLELSGKEQKNEEACFSVPHVSARVKRSESCSVRYTSISGKEQEVEFNGFPAACVQHEVDHLDGLLFLDRVGSAWRGILMNKIRKKEKKILSAKKAAQEEFDNEHRSLHEDVDSRKKITHSKKRKAKSRKKRPRRSKKK
tara:strand:+ start:111 stop:779 length:669 start_codon:yes stop_codon:yes gene_type:complete